jgi:hypothetical protein
MSDAFRAAAGARLAAKLFLVSTLALSATTGCYSYAVAAREPAPDLQLVPIDRMNPQTTTQWQYAWGLTNEPVWSPTSCTNDEKDASGKCLHGTTDPCHGQGIGLYEANVPWYMLLITGVTLGVVSGVRTTFYCATAQGSQHGPSSQPGPGSTPGPQ